MDKRVTLKKSIFLRILRGLIYLPLILSLFFSSHVLADVDEIADRIAVLHDGKLMYVGSTDELKEKYKTNVLEDAYMQCIEA